MRITKRTRIKWEKINIRPIKVEISTDIGKHMKTLKEILSKKYEPHIAHKSFGMYENDKNHDYYKMGYYVGDETTEEEIITYYENMKDRLKEEVKGRKTIPMAKPVCTDSFVFISDGCFFRAVKQLEGGPSDGWVINLDVLVEQV